MTDPAAGGADEEAAEDGWACPVPMAHDRFVEAYYFLRQMDTHYHEPALLRYNLNAFLAALKAVHELLQKELEQAGHVHLADTPRRGSWRSTTTGGGATGRRAGARPTPSPTPGVSSPDARDRPRRS